MSSARPLLRIATRGIRTHRLRTILVVVMIALPVLAMTAAFSFMSTERRSNDQLRQWYFGAAEFSVFAQSRPVLDGANAVGISGIGWQDNEHLRRVDGRVRAVDARGIEPAAWAVLEPAYVLRGVAPTHRDEIAMSATIASWGNFKVGDTVRLDSGNQRITAIVVDRSEYDGEFVVFPKLNRFATTWLIDANTDSDISRVGSQLDRSYGRDQVQRASEISMAIETATNAAQQEIAYLVGAFALVETVFVASAAFAVGARRRVRELALLQAVGADASTAGRIVTIEGVLLGLVGVGLGLAGGLLTAVLSQGALEASAGHDIAGLRIPWLVILFSALAGLVAAIIAAELPARELRKLNVVNALGDRPVQSPAQGRWGVLGLVIAACGSGLIGLAATYGYGGRFTGRAIELGTILIVIGVACWTPIVLHLLARCARRMPLPMRFAMREADRSRRRSSFAVSSVMALVAAVVAISSFGTARLSSSASDDPRIAKFTYQDFTGTRDIDLTKVNAALLDAAPSPNAAAFLQSFNRGNGEARAVLDTGDIRQLIAIDAVSADLFDKSGAGRKLLDNHNMLLLDNNISTKIESAAIVDDLGEIRRTTAIRVGPAPAQTRAILGIEPITVAIISVETLQWLNLHGGKVTAIATPGNLDSDPISDPQRNTMQAALERALDAPVDTPVKSRGFTIGGVRKVLIFAGLALAFGALAVAIALTAVESRRERTVLELVGMAPENRRWLAAARASVLGATGGILGVPAGILPVLLLTKISAGRFRFIDQTFQLDWGVIALVAIVFPIVAGAAGWCWPQRQTQSAELRMPT